MRQSQELFSFVFSLIYISSLFCGGVPELCYVEFIPSQCGFSPLWVATGFFP